MNVPWNPVGAMKMLIAQTPTDHTAVLVNRGSLEMGQFVMVCVEKGLVYIIKITV